ncbi:WAT1-related protein At5g40240-like [Malania oleifera]|uniref:WAT1-related protein At5g40240-like n=1 Tax=Malania oleifera TaxID=397392 RepID=UPI0025AEB74D|nr:WAT1-related protein At5g40240-like [Malania oleifera]
MGVKSSLVGVAPFAAMVAVGFLDVGMTTLSKAAMSRGMSHFVFVVYSNALATLILLPSSFIFLRPPPPTFSLLCKFFLLSLVGITIMQNCVFTGVSYSSPTLGSAIGNLVPAFTFLLVVIFRIEKLDLKSSRCQIKILGTLVLISGAMIITLYKGPPVFALAIRSPSTSSNNPPTRQPSSSNVLGTANNWVVGGLFFATASLCLSIWNAFQASILKVYTSEVTIVGFFCLFGTIQSAALSLIAERNLNSWKLRPDVELISVLYSGVFGSVTSFCVQTWCIHKKGPVFVAMFQPLGVAIAALMGVIFLGDTLYIGSVIGTIIISAGFYGVTWAQAEEEEKGEFKEDQLFLSSQKTPLLHSQEEEIQKAV